MIYEQHLVLEGESHLIEINVREIGDEYVMHINIELSFGEIGDEFVTHINSLYCGERPTC